VSILLWPDKPPQFFENAAPEVIMDNQTIQNVAAPTITPHLLPNEGIQALTLLDAKRAMPIETATNIIADLKKLGVRARLDLHEEGGHGVGNLNTA
jgi:hypothetical protein